MAVFSNDPRAQGLWEQIQGLNLFTASPCPDTREQLTDLCLGNDDMRNRIGYFNCVKRETVKNDCQDYNRYVTAKAEANAALTKYLKDSAKAKADADNKAADFAAEQAILARRRATNASLEKARIDACGVPGSDLTMNVPEPRRTALLEGCHKARVNEANNRFDLSGNIRVTFDEVARERGQSAAAGAGAASGVARALAQPRRTPKPRLPRPTPQPREPRKPVLRAKRVSSASSG